jgi:predicted phage gp36 major capsid-like protein
MKENHMDYDIQDISPEHKSGIAASRGEHDQIMQMFEEFKAVNDERLASLGHRADVLLEEKVDRINGALDAQMKRIDELALKSARPSLDGSRAPYRDCRARAQERVRYLRALGRGVGAAPDRNQGDVGRQQCRWRLSGAVRTRA